MDEYLGDYDFSGGAEASVREIAALRGKHLQDTNEFRLKATSQLKLPKKSFECFNILPQTKYSGKGCI